MNVTKEQLTTRYNHFDSWQNGYKQCLRDMMMDMERTEMTKVPEETSDDKDSQPASVSA